MLALMLLPASFGEPRTGLGLINAHIYREKLGRKFECFSTLNFPGMISAKFLRALLTDEIIALRESRHQLGPGGGGGSESSRPATKELRFDRI